MATTATIINTRPIGNATTRLVELVPKTVSIGPFDAEQVSQVGVDFTDTDGVTPLFTAGEFVKARFDSAQTWPSGLQQAGDGFVCNTDGRLEFEVHNSTGAQIAAQSITLIVTVNR